MSFLLVVLAVGLVVLMFYLFSDRSSPQENAYREEVLKLAVKPELTSAMVERLKVLEVSGGIRPDKLLEMKQLAYSFIWQDVIKDKRITDAEKARLEETVMVLGLEGQKTGFNQDVFTRLSVLQKVDEGVLIDVKGDLPFALGEGERLHWAEPALLVKYKTRTRRISYSGVTASIRIMKGVHYRIGSIAPQTVTSEYISQEATGFIYITNRRFGYLGDRKAFEVPISKIQHIEVSEGLLKVFKSGRENPFLLCMPDYELAMAVGSLVLESDTVVA